MADAADGGSGRPTGSEEQTDKLAQASPALSPTPAPHPGDFAGTERYQILRTLGAGGMGVVYEALDRERDARVALKTLKHASSDALYRLKNEFRSLQQLRHRNLVELGELVEASGEWFFTMELVEGVDFWRYVRLDQTDPEEGASPSAPDTLIDAPAPHADTEAAPPPTDASTPPLFHEDRLRSALAQLADAMTALHDAGKVHRDLKPSNVLVTKAGRLVVLDLGLVADTDEYDSQQAHAVGTVAYMAPEQAACQAVEPAADWYAVGVMLYQALTGALPHTGRPLDVMMAKQGPPPPAPSSRVAGVPADLSELCTGLLKHLPDERADGNAVLACARAGTDAPDESSAQPAPGSSHGAPFVGRTVELALLQKAYTDTRAGQGVTVVVYGESGMGKSALVRRFTQGLRQEDPSLWVLSGRCYEREAIPFKALDGAIDALSKHLCRLSAEDAQALVPPNAALLPRVFPVLGRVKALARAPHTRATMVEDPFEVRKRAFLALRNLFLLVSERHPLVVVLDDIQWADRDSALLLEDLLHPPEEPQLLLVLVARPEGRESPLFTARTRDPSKHDREQREVHLTALGMRDAHTLAELLLVREKLTTTWTAQQVAVEAQGHPLFMDELVRHAATGASSIKSLRMDEALAARVSRLPENERRVVELVALADAPLSQETVRLASQIDRAPFASMIARLGVACLLRSRGTRDEDLVQPYHDRVREAVQNSLDEKIARQRHRRLATALGQTDDGRQKPELWVTHLEAAGKVVEAGQCAVDAARRASDALAFDQAAALYQTALRLGGQGDHDRRVLHHRLAEALVNAGRFAEAAPEFLRAAKGADREARLDCQREAAEKWLASGHVDEGLAIVAQLLGELGEKMPRTPRRAVLAVLWQRLRIRVRGLGFVERSASEIAPAVLHRLDLYHALGATLGTMDHVRGAAFQARCLGLALDAGEPVRAGRALAVEADYLAAQGGRSLVGARDLAARAAALATAHESPYLEGHTLLSHAGIAYFSGGFAQAAEVFAHAETTFRDRTTGTQWEQSGARLFRCFAMRHRGDLASLRAPYEETLADAGRRGDRYLETTLRRRCCVVHLAADDSTAARASLGRAVWTPSARGYHLQHYYAFIADAEIAVYEGAVAAKREAWETELRGFEQSLLTRAQIIRLDAAWLRGRLEIVTAAETGRKDLLVAARRTARRLVREDIGYAQVWGKLVAAGISACEGNADAAITELRDTLAGTAEHDLPLCAAAARYHLGNLLGGTEGAALLAEATAWMTEHGVENIPRFAAFVAPGFEEA